jgi:transcriptional regulator with XRE-family HTH domain
MLRLREWRERRGYSLRRLANLAGVSFTTVHRIEAGRLSPTIEMLSKLAAALEVDIHDLLPPRARKPGAGPLLTRR